MSSSLLLKLQRSTVLARDKDQVFTMLYNPHIAHSNSRLAAYYFLHALLLHAYTVLAATLNPLPRYADSMDSVKFANHLISYCNAELAKNRSYTDQEISCHFLHELDLHEIPVQVELKAIEDMPSGGTLPESLHFTKLALKFAMPAAIVDLPKHPIAHRLQQSSPQDPKRPSSDRPRSAPGPPRRGERGPESSARDRPFRQPEDVQCKACNIWGHSAPSCSGLAKTPSINNYIAAHPDHAATAVKAWKDLHSVNHRAAVAHSLHLLTGEDPSTLDLDDLSCGYQADFQRAGH